VCVLSSDASPLTATAGAALHAWLARRGDRPGKLFLPVSQVGEVHGDGLSSIAVYNMLQKRAAQAGVPHVSPHDLRRSFVVICTHCGHHNVVDREREPNQAMLLRPMHRFRT